MTNCPVCDDVLAVDEEWRLRAGLLLDEPAQEGDYVHEECYQGDSL